MGNVASADGDCAQCDRSGGASHGYRRGARVDHLSRLSGTIARCAVGATDIVDENGRGLVDISDLRRAMTRFWRHLPNFLTALRMCAAPLTAVLILRAQFAPALSVFAFAGLSDVLDGYLARRLSYATRFGVYLDPAADKLLMLASFVTLTMIHAMPALADGTHYRARPGDRDRRWAGVDVFPAAACRTAQHRQGEHGDPGRALSVWCCFCSRLARISRTSFWLVRLRRRQSPSRHGSLTRSYGSGRWRSDAAPA